MIHLDLTLEEQRILADVLHYCLSDLHTEINHTDNWDYKQMLLHRKEVLLNIQELLGHFEPELVAQE